MTWHTSPQLLPVAAGGPTAPEPLMMTATGGSRRASSRRGGAIYGTGGAGGSGPLLRTVGLILIVIVGLIFIAKNCTGGSTETQNLQAEVEATFVLQGVNGVEVAVNDGTAVLTGTVIDDAAKTNAQAWAMSVDGVDDVVNNLVVEAATAEAEPGTLGASLGQLVTASPIKFGSNSADIDDASKATLNQVAQAINASPNSIITITGYTDSTGSEEGNLRISLQRAEAVRTYLIEQGVDGTRLAPDGKGPADPIASNETEDGREANRRIEFTVS